MGRHVSCGIFPANDFPIFPNPFRLVEGHTCSSTFRNHVLHKNNKAINFVVDGLSDLLVLGHQVDRMLMAMVERMRTPRSTPTSVVVVIVHVAVVLILVNWSDLGVTKLLSYFIAPSLHLDN
jgi:hypothetical protein